MKKHEKRTHNVHFRLTEEEYQEAERQRKKTSFTNLSRYTQQLLLGTKLAPNLFSDLDIQKAVLAQLRGIGANINQISRHVNTYQYTDANILINIREELRRIWQLLSQGAVDQSTLSSTTTPQRTGESENQTKS